MDQPTSCSDTNGSNLKIGTFILSLWCFCCLNANYAYKAAEFSGAHFQDNNDFRRNPGELLNSPWLKIMTEGMIDEGELTSKCVLNVLYEYNIHTKGVLNNPKFPSDVAQYLNEWSTSFKFLVNGSKSIVLIDSIEQLGHLEATSNAFEVNLHSSNMYKIPHLTHPSFWTIYGRGPFLYLLSEGLKNWLNRDYRFFGRDYTCLLPS